jgi:hypothetical protein
VADLRAKKKSTSWIVRLISNPVFGVTTGVCGIIGIPLSIYLYFAAKEVPNLSYYASPSRTSIVALRDPSKLKIQYEGQDIKGDLSAALVTIWNAGSKPIFHLDILSPLNLRMEGGSRIIEVKQVNETRPLIGFKIDTRNKTSGILAFDWSILERNDGVRLQVIYQGDTRVSIRLDGAIIGQKVPTKQTYRQPKDGHQMVIWRINMFLQPISAIVSFIAGLLSAISILQKHRPKIWYEYLMVCVVAPLGLFMLVASCVDLYHGIWVAPPFGF